LVQQQCTSLFEVLEELCVQESTRQAQERQSLTNDSADTVLTRVPKGITTLFQAGFNSIQIHFRNERVTTLFKTLLLNPPSFENFDGGASSRWPATREIESYWGSSGFAVMRKTN